VESRLPHVGDARLEEEPQAEVVVLNLVREIAMFPEYAGELDKDRLVVGLEGLTHKPIVVDLLFEGEDLEDVADIIRCAVDDAAEGHSLPDGPPVLDHELIDVRLNDFG